jgi:DNA-binding transcriptional regulator YiaG
MSKRGQRKWKLPRRHFTPKRLDEETMSIVGAALSGRAQVSLARALAPGPATRELLFRLRKDFPYSRAHLAAFLGVGESTLKSWETGRRNPSHAAQRCIWLLDNLLRENKLTDLMELVTWKRIPLMAGDQTEATSPVPHSHKGRL